MSESQTKKFTADVAWNVVSLAVSGVCGIALSFLIGHIYSNATLGVFNQVFAAYILFSQIAALGVHHSALQQIAAAADPGERAASASSALLLTLGLGAIAGVAFWLFAPLIGSLLSSPDVARGMLYAAPGLVFLALSKVTLGCVNATRRMRWYAVLQGSRFVLMLGGFGVCVGLDVQPAALPIVLTAAEIVVFSMSLIAMSDLIRRLPFAELRRRAREHFVFGIKGFMSGVLSDLNTRVDVLMLGYFSTDAIVGVYSFAAILAEGFFQLLVVLRINYAPICARLLAEDKRDELLDVIRRGRNRTYLLAIPAAAAIVAFYTYAAPHIVSSPLVIGSAEYFAVLLAGMAACSGYVPFSQLLLHARLPGWHTWTILGVVAVNIVANAVLISAIGPIGAAAGTATAFVALVAILLVMTRRLLKLPI